MFVLRCAGLYPVAGNIERHHLAFAAHVASFLPHLDEGEKGRNVKYAYKSNLY